MDTSHQFSEILSSLPVENSELQEKVLNLGKLIIKELKSDERLDVLSKWMIFYISEQITLIEGATPKEKENLNYKCFDLILKLWHHRYCFPNNKSPFQRFENIFDTLEQIEPENNKPYFYRKPYREVKIESKIQKWMEIAKGIDDAARVWLTYVFEEASKETLDEEMVEWQNERTVFKEDIMQSSTIEMIKKPLRRVVEDGTAYPANLQSIQGLIAKTGTAQIGTDKSREVNWVIAMNPNNNLLYLVVVDTDRDEGTAPKLAILNGLVKQDNYNNALQGITQSTQDETPTSTTQPQGEE